MGDPVPQRRGPLCAGRAWSSGWAAASRAVVEEQLAAIREAGTYKTERVLSSPQAASVRVVGWDRPVLNLCANNYLGLAVRGGEGGSGGAIFLWAGAAARKCVSHTG